MMKKVKIFIGAFIMLAVLGLNFQKSNEITTSAANLNINYFNTEAKADFSENNGIDYGFGICMCPWFAGAGCHCYYD